MTDKDMTKFAPDFKLCNSTLLAGAVIPLGIAIACFAPQPWGYENGVVENLQLILLLFGCGICLTAKGDKSVYLCFTVILLTLLMRELNCGRVLFWSKSGEMFYCGTPADYLKWRDIPYGSVYRFGAYGILFTLCLITVLRNGTFKKIFRLLTTARIPAWELILLATGYAVGQCAERIGHSLLTEELGETLLYAAILSALYRYSRGYQHAPATTAAPAPAPLPAHPAATGILLKHARKH